MRKVKARRFWIKLLLVATVLSTVAFGVPAFAADSDSVSITASGIVSLKLVFITPIQTLVPGQVSAVMTVQLQNSTGVPVNVFSDVTVNLSTTSSQGRFLATPLVSAPSITSVTIYQNTSSASFYYIDNIVGTPTLTASETPNQGWVDASQMENVVLAEGNGNGVPDSTPEPTSQPTPEPTPQPTPEPTSQPTSQPTPAPPATFKPSLLTVSPREVAANQTVNISIIVFNTGGQSGKYSVVLKVNGTVEATKEVDIAAGASQKVTFTTSKESPGTYSVEVNGLTDSFIVKEEAVPPVEPIKTNWLLIIIVALAVLWRISAAIGFIYGKDIATPKRRQVEEDMLSY